MQRKKNAHSWLRLRWWTTFHLNFVYLERTRIHRNQGSFCSSISGQIKPMLWIGWVFELFMVLVSCLSGINGQRKGISFKNDKLSNDEYCQQFLLYYRTIVIGIILPDDSFHDFELVTSNKDKAIVVQWSSDRRFLCTFLFILSAIVSIQPLSRSTIF